MEINKSSWIIILMMLLASTLSFAQKQKSYPSEKESYPSKKSSRSYNSVSQIISTLNRAEASKNPTQALDLVEEALLLSIETKSQYGEAKSYSTLGKINVQQNLYAKAIKNYNKSIQLFKSLNNTNEIYGVRKLLAQAYEENKEFNKANNEWTIILKVAETQSDQQEIITAKTGIARTLEKLGKEELALKNYKELEKIEEKRGNEQGVISTNNKIGDIYLQQERNKEALSHFSKSQSIATEIEDDKAITSSNELIGKVYRKEGMFGEELKLRSRSIEINKKNNDKASLNDEYLEVGKIYLGQNDLKNAITYLNRSIDLSNELGTLEKKGDAIRNLSMAYTRQGDERKALQAYKSLVVVMDSLNKKNETELSNLLNFRNEINDRQKRIESLEKDQQLNSKTIELLRKEQKLKEENMKKQAILIYALLAGFLIVGGASYLLYKSSQKRRIANQLLALKSLRSQMNPHFIFNALNSVNNFISQNDERSANKYLSEFSKLMRAVMENSQHDFVPLASEVKILELYLSLEHFRFKEKFDYKFEVDEEIHQENILVPPMLIQPYIENAIWHGLRYKEEKGFLIVKIKNGIESLEVMIEDDGIGRKKSMQIKTANQKETVSTGMKNIDSRLKILNEIHKTKLAVAVEDLDRINEFGTKVTITIPVANS